jgi:hypothetical protein
MTSTPSHPRLAGRSRIAATIRTGGLCEAVWVRDVRGSRRRANRCVCVHWAGELAPE